MKTAKLFFAIFILISGMAHRVVGQEAPTGYYVHIIEKGDTLSNIAPDWARDEIRKKNRVDDYSLQIGMPLLVPKRPDVKMPVPVPQTSPDKDEPRPIRVFLSVQYYGYFEHGRLVDWGPVSTGSGKKGRITPPGRYRITEKDPKHVSHNPESWGAKMYFGLRLEKTNIWMHQQSLPGKEASHGCVRETKEDAKKNFSRMKIGDLVVIEE